jgi:hypothetical protein
LKAIPLPIRSEVYRLRYVKGNPYEDEKFPAKAYLAVGSRELRITTAAPTIEANDKFVSTRFIPAVDLNVDHPFILSESRPPSNQ